MSPSFIAIGVILMTTLGLAVGNYATSLTFRLPRGLKIANDPPYCDSCRHYLAPRDLFPFFSWVVNRAKCRFCGAPVPALYAFVELGCALLFNIAFFIYWLGNIDAFITVLGLGVFVITLVSLHLAEKRLFTLVTLLVGAFGIVYRTLLDHSIFPSLLSGFFGLFIGLVLWKIAGLRKKPAFPDAAILLGVAGLSLTKTQLPAFLVVAAILVLLFHILTHSVRYFKGSESVLGISGALMLSVLHPAVAF